nr:hypothetical protein BaRGS_002567 [Batillaria attramentaria]
MQQQQQQQLLQEQEQQQQQKKSDIYEFVLQQKQNEKLLAAAGRGSTQGSTASLNGSQFTGKPSGVGRGVLGIRPGMPGVLARGDGGVGPVGFASGAPGVAGYSAAGTATAVSTIRGSRPLSSQLVSQPTHSLSLSTGRGQTLSMDTSCNNPRQEVNAYAVNGLGNHAAMGATGGSETEEEGGQFVDTPAWVGGGYHTSPGAPGFFDAGYAMGDAPGSYPRLVPGSSSVMASESEASISSSTEEIQKSLKKVRKALRQIDSLENKRSQGIKLNPAEESKVSRKWALETEEAELQNKLEVLSWVKEMKTGMIRYRQLFGAQRVLIADADALKYVLVTNAKNYPRPYFLFGTGLGARITKQWNIALSVIRL